MDASVSRLRLTIKTATPSTFDGSARLSKGDPTQLVEKGLAAGEAANADHPREASSKGGPHSTC